MAPESIGLIGIRAIQDACNGSASEMAWKVVSRQQCGNRGFLTETGCGSLLLDVSHVSLVCFIMNQCDSMLFGCHLLLVYMIVLNLLYVCLREPQQNNIRTIRLKASHKRFTDKYKQLTNNSQTIHK